MGLLDIGLIMSGKKGQKINLNILPIYILKKNLNTLKDVLTILKILCLLDSKKTKKLKGLSRVTETEV